MLLGQPTVAGIGRMAVQTVGLIVCPTRGVFADARPNELELRRAAQAGRDVVRQIIADEAQAERLRRG